MLGFIESIVWASQHFNLNAMKEFTGLMMTFFGTENLQVLDSPKVDPDLKKNLTNLMPSPIDINIYMVKFS